jgi:hypothetical protein
LKGNDLSKRTLDLAHRLVIRCDQVDSDAVIDQRPRVRLGAQCHRVVVAFHEGEDRTGDRAKGRQASVSVMHPQSKAPILKLL